MGPDDIQQGRQEPCAGVGLLLPVAWIERHSPVRIELADEVVVEDLR